LCALSISRQGELQPTDSAVLSDRRDGAQHRATPGFTARQAEQQTDAKIQSEPEARSFVFDLIKRFIGFKNTQCLRSERATGDREDCHWKKVRSTSNLAAASR
jgi:hypothetical protein